MTSRHTLMQQTTDNYRHAKYKGGENVNASSPHCKPPVKIVLKGKKTTICIIADK